MASAQDATWRGANGDDWNNPLNWSGDQKPGPAGTATFSEPHATIANGIADQLVRSITFSNVSGPVTLGSTNGSRLILALNGTLHLSTGASNASGAVTINAPLLIGATGETASGRYTVTSNITALGAPYLVLAGGISGGTSGAVELTLNGQSRGPNTVTGLISDGNSSSLNVFKTSSEEWTLSNTGNTFSGGVSINNGRLRIASIGNTGSASALGTHGSMKFLGMAGTIIYDGAGETSDKSFSVNQETGNATFDHSGSGNLKLTGGISKEATKGASNFILKGSTTGSGEISGEIKQAEGGSLGLIKEGLGTWILSGTNNSYTETTTIRNGTLKVTKIGNSGENSSIGRDGIISMGYLSTAAEASLVYTGAGETTNKAIQIAAAFNGKIVIDHSGEGLLKFTSDLASTNPTGQGINTLVFQGSTNGVGEFAGAIVNGVNSNKTEVIKTGTGKWILSGSSTYTGSTRIAEGELILSGSLQGTTNVTVEGQLSTGPNGHINAAAHGGLTIREAGILSPGGNEGVGTLTLSLSESGKLRFERGSTLSFNLGSETDLITFSSSGNWLAGGGSGTVLSLNLGSGFSYSNTYKIFENVTTSFQFGAISGYDEANYTVEFIQVGDSHLIQFAPIPEGSTIGFIALGAAVLIIYRRSRFPFGGMPQQML